MIADDNGEDAEEMGYSSDSQGKARHENECSCNSKVFYAFYSYVFVVKKLSTLAAIWIQEVVHTKSHKVRYARTLCVHRYSTCKQTCRMSGGYYSGYRINNAKQPIFKS